MGFLLRLIYPGFGRWSAVFLLVGAMAMAAPPFDFTVSAKNADAKTGVSLTQESQAFSITLNDHCPPGFELSNGNKCLLRSLYQQYQSLQDRGVGGLQTALPQVRDGFSPQQIDLGRYLFFDPILSRDHSLSCASCHQPDKGFSDGRATSLGAKDRPLKRSAPSLWNVAFLNAFFWDVRAHSLEEQMQGPLYSEVEMANTPTVLLQSLNANGHYRRLFGVAFGQSAQAPDAPITLTQVYTAITAFEASLISLNSRYDRYAHGYHAALNDKEIAGLNVFRSFVARCAECHTPPLFTNQQVAVLGVPVPAGKQRDVGAQATFQDASLKGGFKVPSLRNIALTAPYMHAGQFDTLLEATAFYNDGRGHALAEGESLKLHWHIWEPNLTDQELQGLVAFMKTLTDESFKPPIPQVLPSGLAIVKSASSNTPGEPQ